MLLAVLAFRRLSRERRRLRAGWSAREGVLLALLGLANGPAFLLLWPWAARPDDFPSTLAGLGLDGAGLTALAFLYLTVNPLLEEVFWRGGLFPETKRLSWADLSFAGYHVPVLLLFVRWPWALAAFPILALTSFTWRRIAARRGGLAVPLVSHLAAGLGTMAALLVLRG